jgi:hypothetical protein
VLGAATVSGDRRSFEDASVVAGHTYRYRLAMWGGDRVTRSPEVAILVPGAARLGFVSLAPMPAGRELTVRFTAPSSAPVRVEMFDIGGRRVLDRSAQVDVAGAGTMMLSLDRTHAGIYWMRLTQGVERVQARVAVVR